MTVVRPDATLEPATLVGDDAQRFAAIQQLVGGSVKSIPIDDEDFVYADPPFDVEFRKYAKEGFDWADQERVAKWLAAHRGPVVLVNQATPRIRRLYADLGFRLEYLSAPRRINSTGDRTPAREVVATRNLR